MILTSRNELLLNQKALDLVDTVGAVNIGILSVNIHTRVIRRLARTELRVI